MSDKVKNWLNKIGLGQYSNAFIENEITWDLLSDLDQDILKDLGVDLAGHKIRILRACAQLDSEASSTLTSSKKEIKQSNFQEINPPDQSHAERRQLTIMFCDLVGSTAMSDTMDPELYRDILTKYQTEAVKKIKAYDGYIARYMGDGLLVYFGYPQANEYDAERGVRAGLAIVEAVSKLVLTSGKNLQVRIGISTGLVVAGDIIGEGASEERAALGEAPNMAARLQGIAEPNTVVVSDSTRQLLHDMFHIHSLGAKNLKGISTPVKAYRVDTLRMTETRFSAVHASGRIDMVGRQEELALLMDRWNKAKNGEGQIVVLSGEAGIGKSCITGTLLKTLHHNDYQRIIYQCSPYHTDSALYPAIQQLTFASRFTVDDSTEERLRKLESLLRQGSNDITIATPLIGALLGIGEVAEAQYGVIECSPQQRREKILQVLVEQLIGISKRKPVLFVLEDAHWIDPTTLNLLGTFT